MQSLTEKQAKERRESRMGRNAFLDSLNDRFGSPFIHTPLWVVKVILCCNMHACCSIDTIFLFMCISERNRSKPSKNPSEQPNHGLFTRLNVGCKLSGLCLCYLILIGIYFSDVALYVHYSFLIPDVVLVFYWAMPSYLFITISMKRKGPCFMVQNFIFFNSNPWICPYFFITSFEV